jgi:hypothetical protein
MVRPASFSLNHTRTFHKSPPTNDQRLIGAILQFILPYLYDFQRLN